MIEVTKDKKSPTWIITKTDSEGFHRQMAVTAKEVEQLRRELQGIRTADAPVNPDIHFRGKVEHYINQL